MCCKEDREALIGVNLGIVRCERDNGMSFRWRFSSVKFEKVGSCGFGLDKVERERTRSVDVGEIGATMGRLGEGMKEAGQGRKGELV